MGSSGIVTLFSEPPQSRLRPSTFLISLMLHGSLFGVLTLKVMQQHRIIERFPQSHFAVRVLDFHSSESQVRQAAGGGLSAPNSTSSPNSAAAASRSRASSQEAPSKLAAESPSPGSPTVTRLTPQRMPAPQTLLQPDIPDPVVLPQKAPVPLAIVWDPEKAAPKKIVLPAPDRAAVAVVHPSLETPIKEENIADLRLSSSAFVTAGPVTPPSTTSPVVVHGPEDVKKVPQTTTKQPDPPTPSRVLSLSDVRVAEGKVTIPVANQTAKATPGTLIPGQLKSPAPPGNGTSTSRIGDKGEGAGVGDRPGGKDGAALNGDPKAGAGTLTGKDAHSGTQTGNGQKDGASAAQGSGVSNTPNHGAEPGLASSQSPLPGTGSGAAPGPSQAGASGGAAQGATSGNGTTGGTGNSSSTVHISLPKDGQFGVVVLGSSIAERYPETAEMWSGRMASTVYLRVGQPKSWILQYALPRVEDAANVGGHIDAPWPYEIARPNIDPADMDADAVILHGFVNKDGRFEKLEVVFPSPLVQAPMIQSVLNQWQFRPAKQNGQPVPVEVLLIIPDQSQ